MYQCLSVNNPYEYYSLTETTKPRAGQNSIHVVGILTLLSSVRTEILWLTSRDTTLLQVIYKDWPFYTV